MKLKYLIASILTGATFSLLAAAPPAEQLLSADTFMVFSVPDLAKAKTSFAESPAGQLFRDPEVKQFKDKFLTRLTTEVSEPLEKALGIKWAEYADLLQGQATMAVTMKAGSGDAAPQFDWVAAMDAREKSDALKNKLAELKKKWADGGKQLKTERIRDVEFTTLSITEAEFDKIMQNAFPKAKKNASAKPGQDKVEFTFGQADSLLILASKAQEIEKVLARKAGGQVQSLAEVAEFKSSQAMFRDASVFGWMNLRPILAIVNKKASQMGGAAANNPIGASPEKMLSALGLDGLKTIAMAYSAAADGDQMHLFVNVPESGRKGIFKALAADAKESAPPAFVPADAVQFSRWRLDGRKVWSSIETMIAEISPMASGILQMAMSQAGKDKDPNFDLKKSLIDNLGDDIVMYQKSPKDLTLNDLDSPPTLFLLGSPAADQLSQAIKAATGLMMPPSMMKEREFLGKKVYSFPMPNMPGEENAKSTKNISFAAGAGYLSFATDDAILEEFLRSSQNQPKSLINQPGLKEASQKIGGLSTGLWAYENQAETMKTTLETLKKESGKLEQMLNQDSSDEEKIDLKSWVDFSLLPSFDKIAKYFHFALYTGSVTPDGFSFRYYSPIPPSLKK